MGLFSGISAGAGSLLGGVAGGLIGAFSASDTNRQSAEEAKRNRQFQREMSNTAIQRRMRDMRKAGINPILAARYDASTPGGAMATFHVPATAAALGASTAIGAGKAMAEIGQIEATTVKVLGETAIGRKIINELGGAEALADLLASNPDLNKKVRVLIEQQPLGWAKEIYKMLAPDTQSTAYPVYGISSPHPGFSDNITAR